MSKIVLLGFPFFSHFNQTIGLVKELIKKGETIIYYSTEEYKSKILNLGAEFKNYKTLEGRDNSTEAQRILDNIKNVRIRKIKDLTEYLYSILMSVKEEAKMVADDIIDEVNKENPDYIIYDVGVLWGKEIAKKLKKYAVSYCSRIAYNQTIFKNEPEFIFKYYYNIPEKIIYNKKNYDTLNYFSKKFSSHTFADLNLIWLSKEFQPYSDSFGPSYKFVGPCIYKRNDHKDHQFNELKFKDKIVIYISLGSLLSNSKNYLRFYKKCFKVLKDMDVQVILNIGQINKKVFKNIPDNFIIYNYAPQLEILKVAHLFITHGGISSISESLYFNTPMIVFPQALDQFLNARWVANHNLGIEFDNVNISCHKLRTGIKYVLNNNNFLNNCKSMGESCKNAGGYKKAVEEIFKFKKEKGIK